MMVAVGDKWGTLSSAVADSDGEVDGEKEFLHLLREGCATDDDLIELAAEGVVHLVADALLHLLVHHGHRQQQTYTVVLYLGEYFLTDDLLDNQRHGDDERWLHVGERLCDDGRTRQTGQEEQMTAVAETEQEFYCHTVHVGHRQDAQHIVAGMHLTTKTAEDELDVAPDGTIGQHDTLREACGSAGIVDERQLLGLVLMVVDVLPSEGHRVLAAEHKI